VTNLTLAIEDDLLKRARLRAIEEGTSVNEIVREFLRDYSGTTSARAAAGRRAAALARKHATEVGHVRWSRDELHARRTS